jgi:exonuclease V gamma subunit
VADAARIVELHPLPPFDEQAFEAASEVFHRAYHSAWNAHPPLDRGEQAHDEATVEGLLAFLGTYTEMTA